METLVIAVVNLVALMLGVASVILVFRLSQKHDHPFLNNYLIFITLAVITGFCDWVILNWVLVLVKGISAVTADLIYHIFWDLLGFPAYLFVFFFLVKTIEDLAGTTVKKRFNNLFSIILIIVVVLNFIGFYLRIKDSPYIFSRAIWMIYTFIWPCAILAFLAFAILRPIKIGMKRHPGYANFALLHFVGFLVWTFLSLLPLNLANLRHMIILAFFLTLFVPALYLYINQDQYMGRPLIIGNSSLEKRLRNRGLSPREIELALLLMAGKSNQEISDEMFISVQTVKNYISKMYKKVGVNSRTQFMGIFAQYPDPA